MSQSGFDTADPGPVTADTSPFQGLGYYTENDAKRFFGRTAERKIILAHLRTAPLTLLYAESGVGKSSLLRAGVAARLRELAAQSMETNRTPRFVPIVFSSWKDEPVDDLISEIERQRRPRMSAQANGGGEPTAGGGNADTAAGPRGRAPLQQLGASGQSAPTGALATAINATASTLDATLLIILDQFEEHFSYRRSASAPERLADELSECINSLDVRANFLIAVREDAYGKLGDLFGGRISNVYDNYLHLEYLTRDAARDAIERPVELYNDEHEPGKRVSLDTDLADAVLDEVRRGNLELSARRPGRNGNGNGSRPAASADEIEAPFLQLVMTRLWEYELSRGSRVLHRQTLDRELGGAETIVRNHVGRALAGLTAQELDTATDIFRDLVTPSGVKVAHTSDDLAKMTAHNPDAVASVLASLYEERIVRAVDPAPGATQARYEIFHDRLAAPILDWRNEQEKARLDRAKRSAELETERQRTEARLFKRRARIMLGLAVGLLVLLAATAGLWLYGRNQTAKLRHEKQVALAEKNAALTSAARATYFGLTTRAQSQLSNRPDVSLSLYLAAYEQSNAKAAERSAVATLDALQRSGAVGVLHGDTDAVESIAFSPTSPVLASASGDGTVRLWKVTEQARYPLGRPMDAGGPQYSVAFAPDGRTLASGGFNEIRIWGVQRHDRLTTIPFPSGAVTSVAFSKRGQMLAAGGSNGSILLWNARSQRRVTTLHVPGGAPVRGVAFSSDGHLLAAGSGRTVTLFDVATRRRLGQPLVGPVGKDVYTVAFSPDNRTLAAAGTQGTVVLWSLPERSVIATMGQGLFVNSIAFSPDGKVLAAAGDQATVLWSLENYHELGQPLTGHVGAVDSVAFSPNGRMLASAGADRTITLWHYPIGRRFGQPFVRHGSRTVVAISPRGKLIASGDWDGRIFLTPTFGRHQRILEPVTSPGPVSHIEFDPTGRILAASYDGPAGKIGGSIRFWNVNTGAQIGSPLLGHVGSVYSVAFSPDGTRLASGDADGFVRLWNVRTHKAIAKPARGDSGAVFAVAFSPDGKEIASGGGGRSIRFWNAHTLRPLAPPLIAQDDSVFALAFSPQSDLLASGGADDTIHLWNLAKRPYALVHTLTGDSGYIRSVAFSPDGKTLASGSTDNTTRLWDVKTGSDLGTPLTGDKFSVESVAFSADGKVVVSGSNDGLVRIWQAVNLPSSGLALRHEICSFLGGGLSGAEQSLYAPGVAYGKPCPRVTPN